MHKKLFFTIVAVWMTAQTVYGQNQEVSAAYLYSEYQRTKSKGNFSQSKELLTQILEGNYELSRYHQALIYNGLGWACYELGQYEKAYECYRIAIKQGSGSGPDLVNIRASIYNNLGLYYNALREYANALEFLGKAQRLLDSIPLQDEAYFNKLSMMQFNRGVALFQLGQVDDALELLKSSEQIKEKFGFSHRGSVYFNLARIYRVRGETAKSKNYFLRGINQWIAEFDSGYFQLANLYKEYGFFLAERGNPEEGMFYIDKALQSYKTNYGEKHPLTASGYKTQGEIYLLQGDYQNALKSLQQALSAVSDDFKQDDLLEAPEYVESTHDNILLSILSSKAQALEDAGLAKGLNSQEFALFNAALATNKLSIRIFQRIQNTFFSEESRLYLISQQKSLFSMGIRLNIKLFELTGLEGYREQAFLAAAKGKSNEFLMEMKTNEWLYLESLTDTIALNTMELGKEVDHLSNQIGLYGQALNPDLEKIVQLQDKLLVTRDSFTQNMTQLTARYPQLASFESIYADLNLNQIRKKLDRKETLLEYFVSGKDFQGTRQLYGFAVNKKECHFYHAAIDSSFSNHVEVIMNKLHGFDPYTESQDDYNRLKSALYEVYRIAFQPLESKIRDKSLIIVPDEKLGYIPFDALITKRDDTPTRNYAGLPYLLHQYDISYLHNTQLLQHKRKLKGRFPKVKAWIPAIEFFKQSNMAALEGAEMEVKGILNIFRGKRILNSLDKKKITEEFLSKDVLHLAMHSMAFENDDQSPYFILGSGNDSLGSDRLYDFEINALSLTSPMVVLSSCESAGGNLQSGEGIKSLSRSFTLGGAESVIHTLWPLEDKKGKEVIIGFYKELRKGRSKNIALSKAKRQYLQSNPNATTHPYYWATFQVNGDPAPLGNRGSMILLTLTMIAIIWGSYFLIRRSFFSRD